MLDVLRSILTAAEIILGLGILIFIHELGHFIMAKRHGVRVEAFSLGMGWILWRRRWGETEYRISAIPLGGYVKMSGENIGEIRTGAEYELTSKPAWARFQIFAAGAIMNLLIAFPIATAAFLCGMYVFSPIVAQPSGPDATAGMRPGDVVVEVNGKPITSLDQYRKELVRETKGSVVPVTVRRNGTLIDVNVVASGSERHASTRPPITTLGKIRSGSPAAKAGLRNHDEILEVNGQRVLFYRVLQETLRGLGGQTVHLKVHNRADPPDAVREITIELPGNTERVIPEDHRLEEFAIREVLPFSPAADAGLRKGDDLRKIGDVTIRSYQDVRDAIEDKGGVPLRVEFEREGKTEVTTLTPGFGDHGKGHLGILPQKTKRIVHVAEDSYYYEAGLRSGDLLVQVDGTHGDVGVMDFERGRTGTVKIEVQRGKELIPITLVGEERTVADFEAAGFQTLNGILGFGPNMVEQRWGLGEAVKDGLREPVDIGLLTFQLLAKLFTREEKATGLAGPVGIFQVSWDKASTGFGNFLWLLMLITVNLGIFNLLPIPVLDGGHILLLGIERLRGTPPSPRFVERFQLMGLLFLLCLIVFVTYNDLGRLFRW
ncbi:MAG: RIP metalloprotease RseP [Planctomycetes bacterium]|nr:RIP metalloprotease RseP [Planctomycetota bacterium]